MCALLSEMNLGPVSWLSLVPLVQSVLKHYPSPKLKNSSSDARIVLINAFAQIPFDNPVLSVVIEDLPEDLHSWEFATARQLFQHAKVASAIDQMHRSISVSANNTRSAARERH